MTVVYLEGLKLKKIDQLYDQQCIMRIITKKGLYTNRELELYQVLSKTKRFWVQINDKFRRNF